ncbi:hypothetical protein ElyMa_002281300 [Elysia marginata]|uniref:Uncharacterized protein n=1 Tax=Elysia marginata TaxID=1093978 RepID=A0AAV4G087_9GAST|nr:hypothetical protein ElyMa_002281300 [Elysia marginata]
MVSPVWRLVPLAVDMPFTRPAFRFSRTRSETRCVCSRSLMVVKYVGNGGGVVVIGFCGCSCGKVDDIDNHDDDVDSENDEDDNGDDDNINKDDVYSDD